MNEDKRMRILVCENNVEGILTAVYRAFTSRYGHAWQKIAVGPYVNENLFADVCVVETNVEEASKVAEAVIQKLSDAAWRMVWQAAEASYEDKADVIYRFLILGFANGIRALDAMTRPEVMRLHKLSKAVSREIEHLYGFLRFQELENHILYGKLVSRHHVGTFLANHFADRLPMENWIIHDPERDEAWVHQAGKSWIYIKNPEFKLDPETMLSAAEYSFKAWWLTFTETIAIRERVNPHLQMQMLPKRYWKYMPEMKDKGRHIH